MKQLIKFLLTPTPDGATYLQVIILAILFIFVIWLFIMSANDFAFTTRGGLKESEDEEN